MKVCEADLPQVIEKFQGTFDSLWEDVEFETYESRELRGARPVSARCPGRRSVRGASHSHRFVTLRPLPFQEEILERLRVEREVQAGAATCWSPRPALVRRSSPPVDDARSQAPRASAPRLLFRRIAERFSCRRDTFRHALQEAHLASCSPMVTIRSATSTCSRNHSERRRRRSRWSARRGSLPPRRGGRVPPLAGAGRPGRGAADSALTCCWV